jgi:outer membrane lipoprotein SlyB
MNTTLSPHALSNAPLASTKPLWAAVSVLGVCVLAMGATLVHVNQRPEPLAQASIPLSSAQADLPYALPSLTAAPMITEKSEEKVPVGVIKPAQSAPKIVAKQSSQATTAVRTSAPVVVAQAPMPTPAPSSAEPSPVVVQAPAKAVCPSCGTIEAVTPITREGQGSGVGVVAGGVLGGVVGNQVGKGNGRAAATVLGAIGGGWAGNAIEKNMKKTTAYSVRVRMEDGSSRIVEQSSSPMVGSKVTVEGNVLRPA